jgi:excisionase family DNA binding protein
MKNRFAEAGIAEGADPWLSLDEAADYLNVRPGWLSERVQARTIVFNRMGHFLRFRKSDLDAYVEAGRVDPVPPEPVVRRRSVPVRKRSAAAGGR